MKPTEEMVKKAFFLRNKTSPIFSDAIHNGLNSLSIHIIDRKRERHYMLSSHPSCEYNFFCDDTHKYDLAITEEMFSKKDSYLWEDCFVDKTMVNRKYAIFSAGNGCVFSRKTDDLYVLHSISLSKKSDIKLDQETKNRLLTIADFCLIGLLDIYPLIFDDFHLCNISFEKYLSQNQPKEHKNE